jgi:hypothetical protein
MTGGGGPAAENARFAFRTRFSKALQWRCKAQQNVKT